MKSHLLKILLGTLISISGSSLSWAVDHPVDIHRHAKMAYLDFGPVDKTYGYLNIVTNQNGKGMINVMFSNGRQTDWVKFNARVTFFDESGVIIKEANLHRWVGSASSEGAAERKVSKPFNAPSFDKVEVEFYMTETQKLVATIPSYKINFTNDEPTSL